MDVGGRLAAMATENADYLAVHGWRKLAGLRRGRSEINPAVGDVPHPAAAYCAYVQKHGAPVLSKSVPKTEAALQAALDRGPHPSAEAHAEFLWEEVYEMCMRRHSMVLPASVVRGIPGVEISPPGVAEQRDRRPRPICDLTFSGVNDNTVDMTVHDSMQFGRALRRILLQIYRADPRWGPVYMLKADIADGFYNVKVNPEGSKHFGIVLPTPPGQEPMVLFFLALPMGWVASPPVFCAFTEMVADLTNENIKSNWRPPPHRHDHRADSPSDLAKAQPESPLGRPPRIRHRHKGPLALVEAYVDDFMGLVQGGKRRRRRIRRTLFHCIDMVFRAPDGADDEWKKDPISIKKLLKGEAALETTKIILGWLVDTIAGTIALPPHRVERLQEMLAAFPASRRSCPKKDLQRLVGELRSMVFAIPGGVGCLSWIQALLKGAPDRVYLNQQFHDAMEDFRWMADDICSRPTRIAEVVPETPAAIGMSDAAGPGMGGVWLPGSDEVYLASLKSSLTPALDVRFKAEVGAAALEAGQRGASRDASQGSDTPGGTVATPILWRHRFPQDIVSDLVSSANPHGSINNSDLELAGIIGNNDVLAHVADILETTTATGTDNSSALSWSTKGAVSTSGPAAYLLRLQAIHQRRYRYQQRNFFVPGVANRMADDCSRLWHLSDSELLSYFNSTYPQTKCWQLCHLNAETASEIHSALRCKRRSLREVQGVLKAVPMRSTDGESGAQLGTLIPPSASSPTPSRSCSHTPSSTATGPWQLSVSPFAHGNRKRLFDSLAKRSKLWATGTSVSTPPQKTLTHA